MCNAFSRRCVGKPEGTFCTAGNQCSSGTCDANHLCEGEDIVEIISNGIVAFGFKSAASKMLFAFIIIIVSTITMTYFAGIVGAVIGFIMGLFATVFVFGWIAVWFLFGLFFILIIGIFLTIFLGKGRES